MYKTQVKRVSPYRSEIGTRLSTYFVQSYGPTGDTIKDIYGKSGIELESDMLSAFIWYPTCTNRPDIGAVSLILQKTWRKNGLILTCRPRG